MLGPVQPRREHQPRRLDAVRSRLALQIDRLQRAAFQQPQHAAAHRVQQPHPDVEHRARNLEAVVEAAEHEARFGQAALRARRRCVRDLPPGVAGEVAMRQVNKLLVVERLLIGRNHHRVGQEIVDEIRAQSAGVAEIARLHRRRSEGQDARACMVGITHQIDQDVDAVGGDEPRRILVRQRAQIGEPVKGFF